MASALTFKVAPFLLILIILQKVTEESLILGCIKRVNDIDLEVALPNQLIGFVPYDRISKFLTEKLNLFKENSEKVRQVLSF